MLAEHKMLISLWKICALSGQLSQKYAFAGKACAFLYKQKDPTVKGVIIETVNKRI